MGDFELIIINDCSRDKSASVVDRYTDPRIRLLTNKTNLGVAVSLNIGLINSHGTYVARMDSDDISLPMRFERQVRYLEENPNISICGTYARIFGESSGTLKHPVAPDQIRCRLLFDTCFVHPTVMFRLRDFQHHELRYEPLKHFEDLDLWQRAIGPLNGANIPEALFQYRVTSNGAMKGGNPVEQEEQYRSFDKRTLSALGIMPSKSALALHHAVRRFADTPVGLDDLDRWLMTLLTANDTRKIYPKQPLRDSFSRIWFLANHYASGAGLFKYNRLVKSPLFNKNGTTALEFTKFLACCRR
jgi:glycosyltransferase involved in cell wall biosynthesis